MKRLLSILLAAGITATAATAGIKWVPADELPLLGKGVDDASTSMRYQRLPDSLENKVKRHDLFRLSRNSAGMAIRFRSDAPSIQVKWKSTERNLMNHQTPTGTRGLDLYMMLPDSTWTFTQSARPDVYKAVNEVTVFQNFKPEMREYMLYLSLYDGVDSLYIGAPEGYAIEAPAVGLPKAAGPVVYYGTSLTQGGCANRPGMAHTNQLQRRLNRDVINLGFSGNGQLDLEVAEVIAAVKDPSVIVLDFMPNVTYEQLDTLVMPFVDIIRAAHPAVPMLMIEGPDYAHLRFDRKARETVLKRRELLATKMEELTARYPAIYFLGADGLTGYDNEATVDGLHFTDVGFLRFTNVLEPIIKELMNK